MEGQLEDWRQGNHFENCKKKFVFSQDANFHLLFFFNHKPEDNLQKR